ncbi:hypothetical protein ES703_120396 [subsurface metagenome]
MLDVQGYPLLEAGKIELLQEGCEFFPQHDYDQQENSPSQERQLTRQYDVVNDIPDDDRLGKS